MRIVFGTPQATEILKADRQLLVIEERKDDMLRDAERRDIEMALKELQAELHYARLLGQPTDALKRPIDYAKAELATYPSADEERAALIRWNSWARGETGCLK